MSKPKIHELLLSYKAPVFSLSLAHLSFIQKLKIYLLPTHHTQKNRLQNADSLQMRLKSLLVKHKIYVHTNLK